MIKIKVTCLAKQILKEEGRTRKWLSDKTGIHYSVLGEIVNNKYNACRLDHALKIANALEVSVEKLFDYNINED